MTVIAIRSRYCLTMINYLPDEVCIFRCRDRVIRSWIWQWCKSTFGWNASLWTRIFKL